MMKESKYLENITEHIKKGAIGKGLEGLILYSALLKRQKVFSKAISLHNRHQRLVDLEQKGLVHLSSAAYLHTRITNTTLELLKSLELANNSQKENDKHDLVLNIREKELGKEMLRKLKTFFRSEFGLAFDVIAK